MDDDIDFDFDLSLPILPGVDLALWLNIVVGFVLLATLATAMVLLV
jgi:hypothetical protein